MRRPVLFLTLAAGLPFTIAACGSRSADQTADDVVMIELPTQVYVTNNNRLDIRVFAFDNTQSIPLGSVSSYTTETFDLPNSILSRGQVRIMADPIGDVTAYVTDLINFSPGQDIEVTVQNNLQLSTFSLR